MKVGLLTPEIEEWHVLQLIKHLRRRNVEHLIINPTKFVGYTLDKIEVLESNVKISNIDALIVRRVPGGSLERVIFRMDILHLLEDLGTKVINSPSSIERTVDKYLTAVLLKREGIPVPPTIAVENFRDAMDAFRRLRGDVVIKPLFGSFGIGIVRITDEDTAYRVFKAINLARGVFYLQKFIPHGNEDLRVFIVGDEIVAAMKRVGESWKTNIAQGGIPKRVNLTSEIEEISIKAAKILGLEYTGVDLIEGEDGKIYVTELNSTPAWRGLQEVSETDIAERIVDYVVRSIRR